MNLNVFLYTTSPSFFSFVFRFLFVRKNVTNLASKIFFRILERARISKRKMDSAMEQLLQQQLMLMELF